MAHKNSQLTLRGGYLQAARWTPLAYGTSAFEEVEHCFDIQTASLDAVQITRDTP